MPTRKIIDAKHNGEKVWLKGHAKAIYMSDGSTVEDTINSIEIPSLDEYVTETELNDKGYLTEHQDISHLASRNWVESQGYAHQEDLLEISFNDIQDSPISIDDSSELNLIDESGNIGLKINNEGLFVKDVIADNHVLSSKVDNNTLEERIDEIKKNYTTKQESEDMEYVLVLAITELEARVKELEAQLTNVNTTLDNIIVIE